MYKFKEEAEFFKISIAELSFAFKLMKENSRCLLLERVLIL